MEELDRASKNEIRPGLSINWGWQKKGKIVYIYVRKNTSRSCLLSKKKVT